MIRLGGSQKFVTEKLPLYLPFLNGNVGIVRAQLRPSLHQRILRRASSVQIDLMHDTG